MATEYISRDDALDCFSCDLGKKDRKISYQGFMVEAAMRIHDIPAADVRPVVHGSWTVTDYGDYQLIECDQCHAQMWNHQSELPNYCYECGADMRPERGTKE